MPVTAICIRPSSATAATRKSSRAWNGLWTTSSTPRWSLAARCPASTASAPPKSNGWSRKPPTGRSCSRGACARRLIRRGCSTRARSWDSGTSCRKGTGGGLGKRASPGPSKDLNGRGGGMKGVAERRFRCSVANDRGPAVSSPVNLPNPAQNRPRLEGSGRSPPAGVRERG